MKSVPLALVFSVLLAFTTVMNAQELSGEGAVRKAIADFAGAQTERNRLGMSRSSRIWSNCCRRDQTCEWRSKAPFGRPSSRAFGTWTRS